jgi:hypothetical protein
MEGLALRASGRAARHRKMWGKAWGRNANALAKALPCNCSEQKTGGLRLRHLALISLKKLPIATDSPKNVPR